MQSNELAQLAEESLAELKAVDVISLHVARQTTITDYMLIASGTSDRHVKSIASNLIERAGDAGCKPIGVEGEEFGEWILVDLGDVVVHVMQGRVREFYKLENLWNLDDQADDAGSAH